MQIIQAIRPLRPLRRNKQCTEFHKTCRNSGALPPPLAPTADSSRAGRVACDARARNPGRHYPITLFVLAKARNPALHTHCRVEPVPPKAGFAFSTTVEWRVIHSAIRFSTLGAMVSSISPYSDGAPVVAVWKKWFNPASLTTS